MMLLLALMMLQHLSEEKKKNSLKSDRMKVKRKQSWREEQISKGMLSEDFYHKLQSIKN
jgi:hypothetical protein